MIKSGILVKHKIKADAWTKSVIHIAGYIHWCLLIMVQSTSQFKLVMQGGRWGTDRHVYFEDSVDE